MPVNVGVLTAVHPSPGAPVSEDESKFREGAVTTPVERTDALLSSRSSVTVCSLSTTTNSSYVPGAAGVHVKSTATEAPIDKLLIVLVSMSVPPAAGSPLYSETCKEGAFAQPM